MCSYLEDGFRAQFHCNIEEMSLINSDDLYLQVLLDHQAQQDHQGLPNKPTY